MKSKHYIIGLLLLTSLGFSQNQEKEIATTTQGVVKSLYGVQLSLAGINVEAQHQIINDIVLRTTIGIQGMGISYGNVYRSNDNTRLQSFSYNFGFQLNLEPRWYYNMNKRNAKGKNTNSNSANFIGLQNRINLPWLFYVSSADFDRANFRANYSLYAVWGLRRTFTPTSKFYFEFLGGLGYTTTDSYIFSNIGVTLNASIGYRF